MSHCFKAEEKALTFEGNKKAVWFNIPAAIFLVILFIIIYYCYCYLVWVGSSCLVYFSDLGDGDCFSELISSSPGYG